MPPKKPGNRTQAKEWKPRLGRWKKSSARQNQFIARGLLHTRKPMKTIAVRAGVSAPTVQKVNRSTLSGSPIRSAEESHSISRAATKNYYAKHREEKQEQAIKHFTPQEKTGLLENNRLLIYKIANQWWFSKTLSSRFIRNEFGTIENFAANLGEHAFAALDFYDPAYRGKNNRLVKPTTFLYNVLRNRCLALAADLREKNSLHKKSAQAALAAAQTTAPRTPAASEPGEYLPRNMFSVLNKLGIFENSRKSGVQLSSLITRLDEIAGSPDCGLTAKEQKRFVEFVHGKEINGIAARTGVSVQACKFSIQQAIKKIKKYIQAQDMQ